MTLRFRRHPGTACAWLVVLGLAGGGPALAPHPAGASGETLSVSLSSPTVPDDGTSRLTVTVRLTSATGAPVSGQPVRFTTDGDVTLAPPVQVTGSDGTATATLIASVTAGAETISATAGDGAAGSATLMEGPGWTQASAAANPVPALGGGSIAADEARGTVVQFGGAAGELQQYPFQQLTQGSNELADTQVWNGTAWLPLAPATSPPARIAASMAYDPATRTVVLFGGMSGPFGQDRLGDTWTWDGVNWTQQHPAVSPSPRASAGMAYDAATGRVLLFGGDDRSPAPLSDTWAWDGTGWSEQHVTNPPGRSRAAMSADRTGGIVLFGGYGGTNNQGWIFLGDTWRWNGTTGTWAQLQPAQSPLARLYTSSAYDDDTRSVVLIGGTGLDGYFNDTWTWDGSTWTQQSAVAPPRGMRGLGYDVRDRTLVTAGNNVTWTYLDASATRVSLTPATLPADGRSTAGLTVAVTGVDGLPSTAETLGLASTGGLTFGPVTNRGDGTYAAAVTATSTPGVQTVTVTPSVATVAGSATLTQLPSAADFALTAMPAMQTVNRGGAASYTIDVTRGVGFSAPVTLALSGLPAGVGAVFDANPVAGASATLTVTPGPGAALGSHALTITGVAGVLSHTTLAILVVNGVTTYTGRASAVHVEDLRLAPALRPVPDGGLGLCDTGPVTTTSATSPPVGGSGLCSYANGGSASGAGVTAIAARELAGPANGGSSARSTASSVSILPGMGPGGTDVLDATGLDSRASASCTQPPAAASAVVQLTIAGQRVATQPVGSQIVFNPRASAPGSPGYIRLYGNPIWINPTGARIPMAIVSLNYSRYDPGSGSVRSSPVEIEFPAGGALSPLIVGRVFLSYTQAGVQGCA